MIKRYLLNLLRNDIRKIVQEELFDASCQKHRMERQSKLSAAILEECRARKLTPPENCTFAQLKYWFDYEEEKRLLEMR